MSVLAEAHTATTELPEPDASDATARLASANSLALDIVFGLQRAMIEHGVFAATENLDRAQTETHLSGEFISKLAESHSVKDLKTMWRECYQHQIDFIRRDWERVFKHCDRILQTTSNLFAERTRS